MNTQDQDAGAKQRKKFFSQDRLSQWSDYHPSITAQARITEYKPPPLAYLAALAFRAIARCRSGAYSATSARSESNYETPIIRFDSNAWPWFTRGFLRCGHLLPRVVRTSSRQRAIRCRSCSQSQRAEKDRPQAK